MIPSVVQFDYARPEFRTAAQEIRHRVFVVEQQVPEELEYDQFDSVSSHYLMFVSGKAVATCRWRRTSQGLKLERFAVLKEFRGKGYGELLLRQVMNDVQKEQGLIYLHAQEQVVGFYLRSGFVVEGDVFEEAGIRHYRMNYKPGNS